MTDSDDLRKGDILHRRSNSKVSTYLYINIVINRVCALIRFYYLNELNKRILLLINNLALVRANY